MRQRTTKFRALLLVALAALAAWCISPPRAWSGGQGTVIGPNPAPSPAELNALIARAVENQHKDDRTIEEFERIEHVSAHNTGENFSGPADHTERVVPSGTGIMRLRLAENGVNVSGDKYRSEIQIAVNALNIAIHPNDRYRADLLKFERRRRDRADLVESAQRAFRLQWAGRESRPDPTAPGGTRVLAKILLDPDPGYKPISMFASTFTHVRGALWVDESAAQFARLDIDISSDINFVAGIAGKVNHGGHLTMEQSEVAPGIWFPTLLAYDVDGRKFFSPFTIHERTELSRYRRIGPPSQSIELFRAELDSLTAGVAAH